MPLNQFLQESDKIFSDTIGWYQTQKQKARSKTLSDFLKKEIEELQLVQQKAQAFFKKGDKAAAKRAESRKEWMEGLKNQQKFLDSLISGKPSEIKGKAANDYDNLIAAHRKIIADTESNIKALENLWTTEDRIGGQNQQDAANAIMLFVSLKISRATFNKIADSVRTVITSIPGISNTINIINGGYDLIKTWITPVKDTKNVDAFFVWLEQRRAFLNDLQAAIRRSEWIL